MQRIDEGFDTGPETFTVGVLLERSPVQGNRWISERWRAIGLAVGRQAAGPGDGPRPLVAESGDGGQVYLWPGFELRLHRDETESYHINLVSSNPAAFVVVREAEGGGMPQPCLVSLSYDEAHAFLEAEEQVFSVPLPPELHRWLEAYVVAHHAPAEPRKRKREDWKARAGKGERP